LTWLLISLALVHVRWQEDTTFPKQQCINAWRDTVSTHTSHSTYRHYSLGGRQHRTQLCRWLVEKTNEDADLSRVLWTDESHFAQMGIGCTTCITGTMKTHISREREREHQVCWSLNMWVGLLGDCIIGPYLLPECLTAETYYTFISEALPVVPARWSTTTLWAFYS
jgi:hypothetical protein